MDVVSWPRGKRNGARIGGFRLSLRLNVWLWSWRPFASWNFGAPYIGWLCLRAGLEPEYQWSER